ncbi:uncharacterized protein LOC106137169 isoform X2 [Amyelois transitella]|uniref:uncharacterized protein LOC106137169 isoform X2 n=1 Tax=Amyelois transitella TaxID=680683 RepID=UPI00298F455B|nr:uncharacterized protein LOC106137169 isoform X2 [Amyelois transitella]
MEEENKLPLKRVELSLTKFNEVAIPHHLDLLRQHKANILKYEESGEYTRVRAEQTNARRVASQLRVLLGELDCLRRQVRNEDLVRFDALTKRSRDNTLRAIVDYLGSCNSFIDRTASPAESPPRAAHSAASSESVGVLAADEHDAEPVQLQLDTRELQLRAREDALRGWGALQAEVRALHDAWQHVQAAALAHRQQVEATASHVEEAAENVVAARADLSMAEKLRAASYGAGGALCGALLGGPAGALLGAKAAACAALAGSALGYAGARLLGRRRREQIQKQQ